MCGNEWVNSVYDVNVLSGPISPVEVIFYNINIFANTANLKINLILEKGIN
jgi:hypothetical protein